LRVIAQRLGFGGVAVDVTIERLPLTLFVRVDDAEHDRRQSCGLAACTDQASLCALNELPAGFDLSIAGLPPEVRALLQRLPNAVITTNRDVVRRNVQPPVHINAAFARGRQWQRVERALGPFVTVCPRIAVLEKRPRLDSVAMAEAAVYGIGLIAADDDGLAVLALPKTPTREFGAYQWRLAEVAYDAWLATYLPKTSLVR
jgi:hypothetical protein